MPSYLPDMVQKTRSWQTPHREAGCGARMSREIHQAAWSSSATSGGGPFSESERTGQIFAPASRISHLWASSKTSWFLHWLLPCCGSWQSQDGVSLKHMSKCWELCREGSRHSRPVSSWSDLTILNSISLVRDWSQAAREGPSLPEYSLLISRRWFSTAGPPAFSNVLLMVANLSDCHVDVTAPPLRATNTHCGSSLVFPSNSCSQPV